MKTKLHELLKFPCLFTYKIIGESQPELICQIVKIVQQIVSVYYKPLIKKSRKDNFHSVSITIIAANIEQIEKLYEDLSKLKLVRIVL
ncbi:MAG: DUF493 family protein YbeD [Arsenophonus sp.]